MTTPTRRPGRPAKPPGSCRDCSEPPAPGRVRCPACLTRHAAYHAQRADSGICRCGSAVAPGRRSCPVCLKRDAAARMRRYAAENAVGS